MFLTGMKYVARCNVILKKLVYQFIFDVTKHMKTTLEADYDMRYQTDI